MADHFGIARALAAEIVYLNDERFGRSEIYRDIDGILVRRDLTPEVRWQRMREWVDEQISHSAEAQDAPK